MFSSMLYFRINYSYITLIPVIKLHAPPIDSCKTIKPTPKSDNVIEVVIEAILTHFSTDNNKVKDIF